MKNLSLILFVFLGFQAFAQTISYQEFVKLTDKKKHSYLQENTTESDEFELLEYVERLNPELQSDMESIANEASYLWYDTVLEGPYAMTGEVKVSLTSVYMSENNYFAVSGIMYATGVFTEDDQCEYDEENDQWSQECSEVTIYEHFIMDMDGTFIESDYYPEVDAG